MTTIERCVINDDGSLSVKLHTFQDKKVAAALDGGTLTGTVSANAEDITVLFKVTPKIVAPVVPNPVAPPAPPAPPKV